MDCCSFDEFITDEFFLMLIVVCLARLCRNQVIAATYSIQ
jgi:hypothetical protein